MIDQERAEFERCVLVETCTYESDWDEAQKRYVAEATQHRWLGWQAGRKALRGLVEELRRKVKG